MVFFPLFLFLFALPSEAALERLEECGVYEIVAKYQCADAKRVSPMGCILFVHEGTLKQFALEAIDPKALLLGLDGLTLKMKVLWRGPRHSKKSQVEIIGPQLHFFTTAPKPEEVLRKLESKPCRVE